MVQEVQAGNRKKVPYMLYIQIPDNGMETGRKKVEKKKPTHLARFWPILTFLS